jgi:hypothetical protein
MKTATRVLERITRLAPLGIRFWDEVSARVVSDGLVVEVYASGDSERRTAARPNRSGVFVLPHLPGSRDPSFELGTGDAAFWQRLQPRPHVLEVNDRTGCFQPFTLDHPAPSRMLAMPACLPPANMVPLFSTPARPVPEGMAVVRADLVHVPVQAAPVPASWAVLEVRVPGHPPARGVADREGRVAVIFPWPGPIAGPARPASPPHASGSLWDQEWAVRLDAFYDPVAPAPCLPDLCRTLTQRAAMLWTDSIGTRPLPDQTLRYGQESIAGALFVTTAGSPP